MGLRARPLGLLAAGLVALEALLAALDARVGALAVAVLVIAPGLALIGLLPERTRRDLVTALAAAPVVGFAATSVGLITAASLGLSLDGATVRVVCAVVVAAGLALRTREPRLDAGAREALVGAGLLAAVIAGVVLEARVLSGAPVPGNDWAKYVLYADEIRRHGALLIDNPYWMLGVPFREDPGIPALYGSYLLMTEQAAGVLMHGIWAFAVISILAAFALVRSLWGTAAGLVAALLWAVLPISQDILAWHGLPNLAALALLALVLLYVGCLFREELPLPAVVGLGLTLVALAATHRLSLVMCAGTLAITLAVAFVLGEARRLAVPLARAGLAAAVLGGGVAYDVIERQRTFGGTLSYAQYLDSKFAVVATMRDLTFVFTAVALVAVVVALRAAGRDRALIGPLALLGFTLAAAYAWVVQLPMAYVRMAYYLPLALVPLVAVALVRLPRPRYTVAATAVLAAIAVSSAWPAASNVKRFYAFVDPASLRGLDAVAAQLRPDEVVVTDRCWSFLSTWLLHTPVLPALFGADIQPKAELARARQARAILDGTPAGEALARDLGIRYVLVDPTCPDPEGIPLDPPRVGTPAYISERLIVLQL